MYHLKLVFSLFVLTNYSLIFSLDLNSSISNINPPENPFVIALMVEFQEDNNPKTSGNGLFLDTLDINMKVNPSLSRCDQFVLDRPPHNSQYFNYQIEAVSNYYKSVSNENIIINSHIIMNPENENGYYKLSKDMEKYSYSDETLSALFKESLELAKSEIESFLDSNSNIDFDDIIFTVFHAGIGQDFSFPTFDPTVYDIKSAYIEPSMFGDVQFPEINGNNISSGILLPETQNMIFFSSIEDIFYGESSYCDYQLGMTGTFSFLMGYAIGLPPLFNTDTGKPGVGIFGLMDYGSNNGRGIIPSIPSPWTRILMDWKIENNMTNLVTSENFSLININRNDIYKFEISDKEYFLIENKINTLDNGLSIEDIVADYNDPENQNSFRDTYTNWLDAIVSVNDQFNIFEFQDSIITNVINYDLGLPSSGILLWHIDEPSININQGINNNPLKKAVSVEEADGVLDIGFQSYALFSNYDPTSGTRWDLWYQENIAYHDANQIDYKCYDPITFELLESNYNVECFNNGGIWLKTETFDNYSNPNSNLNDNTKSFFSFEIIDSISNSTKIKASYQSSIPYFNLDLDFSKILGTSRDKIFYGLSDMSILELDLNDFTLNSSFEQNYNESTYILTNDNNISNIYNSDSLFVYLDTENNLVELPNEVWFGNFINNENDLEIIYLENNQFISDDFQIQFEYEPSSGLSIADVDKDGLDEIIFADTDGKIVAYNGNGSLVNGFPFGDSYYGIVLAVSERDSEDLILICRNSSHIDIIDLKGNIISLPALDSNSDIMVVNDLLYDGKRFYNLDSDDSFFRIGDIKYWTQRYNNHSHYPKSSYVHDMPSYNPENKIVTSFYNYPNPITNDQTKFRFYINEQVSSVKIKIYDILGNLVDTISKNDLIINEYNEIIWTCNNYQPGLYFAEILCSNKQQDIIKIVIDY